MSADSRACIFQTVNCIKKAVETFFVENFMSFEIDLYDFSRRTDWERDIGKRKKGVENGSLDFRVQYWKLKSLTSTNSVDSVIMEILRHCVR